MFLFFLHTYVINIVIKKKAYDITGKFEDCIGERGSKI